jgi:hypothetical protein
MKQFYFLLIVCLLFGCSSEKMTKVGEFSKKPVQTSGNKNSWVDDDIAYWKTDTTMYFKVQSNNETDLPSANDGLYLLAIQAIGFHIAGEAKNYIGGDRFDAKYSKNAIGNAQEAYTHAKDSIKFSCVREREYWEQFEKNDGNSVSYYYTISALFSMPVEDYERARKEAWDKATDMVLSGGDKEAYRLFRESKEEFFKEHK